MFDKYTSICEYIRNEGFLAEVTDETKHEILGILNLQEFSHRETPSSQNLRSELKSVISELENEADERLKKGEFTPEYSSKYPQNCHSLARKMQERNQEYLRVFGYVFEKNDLSKPSMILRSHSVLKDEFGKLVELTIFFDVKHYYFIEHFSGENGNDLMVYKDNLNPN